MDCNVITAAPELCNTLEGNSWEKYKKGGEKVREFHDCVVQLIWLPIGSVSEVYRCTKWNPKKLTYMINMTSSRSIERNSKLANIQSSRPNQCGQKVIHYLARKRLFGLLDLRENSQMGKMGPSCPFGKRDSLHLSAI